MSFGFNRNRHAIKTGFLSAIVFFSIKAAISAPLFVVEKTLEPPRMNITVTSSQLPELKSITFTCSYTVPVASLMESIISSPQPGTALSVLVDTATSTLSVTIHATATMTPAENARIIILKIPVSTPIETAGFTITKAIFIDKAGTPVTATVNNKTTGISTSFPVATPVSRRRPAGSIEAYRIDGKKFSGTFSKQAGCMIIQMQDGLRIASFITIR